MAAAASGGERAGAVGGGTHFGVFYASIRNGGARRRRATHRARHADAQSPLIVVTRGGRPLFRPHGTGSGLTPPPPPLPSHPPPAPSHHRRRVVPQRVAATVIPPLRDEPATAPARRRNRRGLLRPSARLAVGDRGGGGARGGSAEGGERGRRRAARPTTHDARSTPRAARRRAERRRGARLAPPLAPALELALARSLAVYSSWNSFSPTSARPMLSGRRSGRMSTSGVGQTIEFRMYFCHFSISASTAGILFSLLSLHHSS